MDIFCPKCCEPCDIDTLHEFVAEMRDLFPNDGYNFDDTYRRFVSEGCGAAFPGWGWSCEPASPGRGAVLGELAELLGDDVDGFAALCEDLESFGGAL